MDDATGEADRRSASEAMSDAPGPATSEGWGAPDTTTGGDQPTGVPVTTGPVLASSKRTTKRSIAVIVSAVAVVGLVIGVLVATVGSTPNADAAVITAINSAMGQKTAHVVMTASVAAAGQTEGLTGTGDFDFTDNAEQMNLDLQSGGQGVPVQLVYVGGTAYEKQPAISQVAPGKEWVSLDLSGLQQTGNPGAALQLGGDPIATLHVLAQQGNTVSDLGASVINGTSVEGYSVTLDPAVVKQELSRADLPAWMKQAATRLTFGGGSQDVYLDGAGNLVRLSSIITESVGSTGPVKVQKSMDFSDFGTPVSIATPPADDVIPFSQYLQLADQSQAT